MSIDKDQEEWGGEGKVHQELSELDQRRDEGLSSKMRAGSVRQSLLSPVRTARATEDEELSGFCSWCQQQLSPVWLLLSRDRGLKTASSCQPSRGSLGGRDCGDTQGP